MTRDFRNDFMQEIKINFLNEATDCYDYDFVISIISSVLEKYELSERSTDLVTYDDLNSRLLKTYAGNMIIDGKSHKTIQAYIRELNKFVYFIKGKHLTDVCTYDIRNYLAQEKVRGISNRTLENSRANLSAFFQWLTIEDYVSKNPCMAVRPIKFTEEVKKPFTTVEIDRLRHNCKNEKERAMIEVLLSSGIRVSEFISLNVEDIDFNTKTVHVRHGKGNKERITYIDDLAYNHLVKYLTENNITSGAIFCGKRRNRYTESGIRALLNTIAERSNVQNVHPHRFRRTFATTLAVRGMNIQEIQKLMGHTNINTTMVYIAMDNTIINNSYRKFTS